MKKTLRKLALSKETLRSLTQPESLGVAGAGVSGGSCPVCPVTYTCETCTCPSWESCPSACGNPLCW